MIHLQVQSGHSLDSSDVSDAPPAEEVGWGGTALVQSAGSEPRPETLGLRLLCWPHKGNAF